MDRFDSTDLDSTDDAWIDLGLSSTGAELTGVATLGPAGTSSEQAALALWHWLDGDRHAPVIQLHPTYESASEALRRGEVSHLVVANAYSEVNLMYMSPAFELVGAFIQDTPNYGLAANNTARIPPEVVIASHPAPVPLVAELLPESYQVGRIVLTPSTSVAAHAARSRQTDLALTTAVAAAAHGLRFISRTRTIRMLWSVFTRPPAPERASADRAVSAVPEARPAMEG